MYHIQGQNGRRFQARLHHRLPSGLLILEYDDTSLPWGHKEPVRVFITTGLTDKVYDYNPQDPVVACDKRVWLYGQVPISKLVWDSAEWRWRKLGTEGDCDFFGYSTKFEYKISLAQLKPRLPHIQRLRIQGYSAKQITQILKRIWHPWVPRKICAMTWLTLAEGLPIGSWRHKAGWESHCRVCNAPGIETAEHALRTCAVVARAW